MSTTPDDANWWRRSSFCGASAGCLEASRAGRLVLVRDSKQPSAAGVIQQWTDGEWLDLLNAVKLGAHHVAIDVLGAEHVHVKFGLHRHEPLYFDRVEWNAFIHGVDARELEYATLPSYASTLSSPVPVSGGLQVDGANEVGVGGGSNLAATGAGAIAVPPVPVAAAEPADKAFVLFDHHLDMEVWYRDDVVAAEARISSGSHDDERWFKVGDYDGDPLCWANVLAANPDNMPVPLMRADALETSADSRLREAAVRAAGLGEADPVLRTPGTGSAVPDREEIERRDRLAESWAEDD